MKDWRGCLKILMLVAIVLEQICDCELYVHSSYNFFYYRMNIDGVSIGTGNLNCHEFILKKKSRSKTRVSLKAFKDDLPENVANLYIRI